MLSVKNVTKVFSGLFEPVLKGVNLSLKPGDFCTLVGTNGSGKSTLLRLINGEYLPDSGTIECAGKIAHVVQEVNLSVIPEMTLLENIAFSEMQQQKPKFTFYRRYKEKILATVKMLNLGLEVYIDQPLNRLSGGQRQTVATLMALHSGCQILLLDEHTSALDPKTQALLMQYTEEIIGEQNLTTIMITHQLDDAIRYGNRLVMLHKGNIILDTNDKKGLKEQDLLTLLAGEAHA